jgi:glycosyltransferase involved in cell wall biosynthesis
MSFLNPLEHPICLEMPHRLSAVTSWHGHIPFAMFIVDVTKPKVVVELGTHYGDSYCAFCQAVKELKLPTRCYAVDTWQGDPQAGAYGPEVLADLRAHHDPLYGSFSRLIQSTFDDAVSHFTDGTIDILHIDGYHIYEMIKHDFETWLPKVSKQGIILLHDINVMERDYGARKFWDEINIKYPHFEFLHSHGLGVLATGKTYPKELRNLFGGQDDEIAGLRSFFAQLGDRIMCEAAIDSAQHDLQSHRKEVEVRGSRITELDNYVKSLEITLGQKEYQINEINASLVSLNHKIESIEVESKGKSDQMVQLRNILEFEIDKREHQIIEMKSHNKDLQVNITELKGQIKNREGEIAHREKQITKLEDQTKERNSLIQDLQINNNNQENQIKVLAQYLLEAKNRGNILQVQLSQIQHGIPMRLRNKYQVVIEKLLRQGTRRRRYYQFGLKGVRIILNEGWNSFWKKSLNYLKNRRKKSIEPIVPLEQNNIDISKYRTSIATIIPQSILPVQPKEIIPTEDDRISVVIPVKNAGKEFGQLLSVVNNQKGLKEVEVIVVDSGSNDGSVDIAKAYGAKVMEIPPEKFSHAYSRNLGAEAASGKYLFFTTQDALPGSEYFLFQLLSTLKHHLLAAVSCVEFPREDADLFYRTVSWYHYNRFLELENGDRIMSLPSQITTDALRKNGQVSDIDCLITKDIFMKYRYQRNYAEDLDLGIKLIKDGYKLALLTSVSIIHSHNRPTWYWIRRGYVDSLFLTDLFSDYPIPTIDTKSQNLWRSMIRTYHSFSLLIENELSGIKTEIELNELFDLVYKNLESGIASKISINNRFDSKYADDGLNVFLKKIAEKFDVESKTEDNIIARATRGHLSIIKEYMEKMYPVVDQYILQDFKRSLFKAFALQCGAHIAFYRLNGGDIEEWDKDLREGI